jgi:hypothetical protein
MDQPNTSIFAYFRQISSYSRQEQAVALIVLLEDITTSPVLVLVPLVMQESTL